MNANDEENSRHCYICRRGGDVWVTSCFIDLFLVTFLPPTMPDIALATGLYLREGSSGDCGLVKWCRNAAMLMHTVPALRQRGEIAIWANERGKQFVAQSAAV